MSQSQSTGSLSIKSYMVRYAPLAALMVAAFSFLIWGAGSAGLSRLLSAYGLVVRRIDPVNAAVELGRGDAEAHYARAVLLMEKGDLAEGIKEYEQAVRLRPDDYFLWLELARGRDLKGDTEGALKASQQAVLLAPYYAGPRWHLGNLLLRAGRYDEAFTELRRAVASDPSRLPVLIDLAWQIYNGNVKEIEQSIQPQTDEAYLALAQFFRKRGEIGEAIAMLRGVSLSVSEPERRAWINELISAKRFPEAYGVWSIDQPSGKGGQSNNHAIINGGFENEIALNNTGFGWQLTKEKQTAHLSFDTTQPKEGASSLRVDFSGDSPTSTPLLSQLVIVEARTSYRLHFIARTEEIISGGLPHVMVFDASSDDQRMLGESPVLPQGTSDWRDYTVDFVTGDATSAVRISVQRQSCSNGPCPIYGRLWLDNFTLQKQ